MHIRNHRNAYLICDKVNSEFSFALNKLNEKLYEGVILFSKELKFSFHW